MYFDMEPFILTGKKTNKTLQTQQIGHGFECDKQRFRFHF